MTSVFEQAERRQRVSKADYHKRVPSLRQELLDAQQALRAAARSPVIVLFAGVDAAGKGETVNLLNAWLDPRWLVTKAYDTPSDEELERPEFWRYWRDLPPKGRIGLFLSAWYSRPVLARAYGELSAAQLDSRLEHILNFEKLLAEDGALIVKFWLHLGKKQQRKRLQTLEQEPLLRWRVSQRDWDHWHLYQQFVDAAEQTLERTARDWARWHIVEGWNARHRSLTIGEILCDAIRVKLGEKPPRPARRAGPKIRELAPNTPLAQLDLGLSLSKTDYRQQLKRYQAELNGWRRKAIAHGVTTVVVFEGMDAAGKGGAIRRITAALDARRFQVIPIAAPSDEEHAHHYLWRFWRHLPRAGRVVIFDRSWYGRVLVERIEGFAEPGEWRRAYGEINDFEAQLVEHGSVLVKLWMQIDKDEQLRRFQEREATAHKQWKLTDEDWRNRERWPFYQQAAHDMIEHTSTDSAPWTLVEANDKRYARVKVLKTLCEKLQEVLG